MKLTFILCPLFLTTGLVLGFLTHYVLTVTFILLEILIMIVTSNCSEGWKARPNSLHAFRDQSESGKGRQDNDTYYVYGSNMTSADAKLSFNQGLDCVLNILDLV